MDNTVTEQDVRMFLLDRGMEDNPIDLDVSFTTEEITAARRNAIRHYNSIPPVGVAVGVDSIPDGHTYLLGITYYLYLSGYLNLSRNVSEYQAGGMSASVSKTRLQLYAENIKLLKQEFIDAAASFKNYINQDGFYGRIG